MTPVHFILLGLVRKSLIDAACLSATYTHVLRQQTNKNLTYILPNVSFFILFICFALSNLRYLRIIKYAI